MSWKRRAGAFQKSDRSAAIRNHTRTALPLVARFDDNEWFRMSRRTSIATLLGLGLVRAEERTARWLPGVQGALAGVGVLIAGILGAMLWVSRGIHSTSDISTLMQLHPTSFYRLAMSDFMDLTPETFADLRHQALTAMGIVLIGLLSAWWLRKRRKQTAASVAMGCMMAAFFFCANWAFGVFTPRLSSEPIARLIMKSYRPGDKIALYDEYDWSSSLGFYTGKRIWIFNGRHDGLEFGSYYPDAPHIFLDDHTFWPVWRGSERVFLVVPPELMRAALVRMPPEETYLFAAIGGKEVYVNHRVTPDVPTLGEVHNLELQQWKH